MRRPKLLASTIAAAAALRSATLSQSRVKRSSVVATRAKATMAEADLLSSIIRTKQKKTDFKGARVGLYFAAGWCPMCTSFEPSLAQFVEATRSPESNAPPVQLIYVSSDMDEAAAEARAAALGMDRVDFAMAQALKTNFKIWSGRERPEFGDGRRGGVPAIVVVDRDCGELQYLNAEGEGAAALGKWKDEGAW